MSSQLDKWRLDRSVISVVPSNAESDEIDYWLKKTPDERLEAGEMLRQVAYGYDPSTARLQRVLEFVRNPWG
jgi:hypothetical protein